MNNSMRIDLSKSQNQDRKRFLRNRFLSCVSWLLVLVVVFSVFPAGALAAEPWQASHDKGIELARAGDFKQALVIFSDLRSRYPNAAPVWIDSAMVLHWSGDDKGATDFYEAKLRIRRDLPVYLKEAMAGKTFAAGPTDHDSTILEVRPGVLEDQLSAPLVTKENVDDKSFWGNQL